MLEFGVEVLSLGLLEPRPLPLGMLELGGVRTVDVGTRVMETWDRWN